MTNRRPLWSQCWIAAHLAIFVVAGYASLPDAVRAGPRPLVAHLGHEPVRSERTRSTGKRLPTGTTGVAQRPAGEPGKRPARNAVISVPGAPLEASTSDKPR